MIMSRSPSRLFMLLPLTLLLVCNQCHVHGLQRVRKGRVWATWVTRRHGAELKASHMLLIVWRELGRVSVPVRTVLVGAGEGWGSKWGAPGPKPGAGSMLTLRTLGGGEKSP